MFIHATQEKNLLIWSFAHVHSPPLWEYHTFMLRRMERIVRSAKMRIVGGATSHGANAPEIGGIFGDYKYSWRK